VQLGVSAKCQKPTSASLPPRRFRQKVFYRNDQLIMGVWLCQKSISFDEHRQHAVCKTLAGRIQHGHIAVSFDCFLGGSPTEAALIRHRYAALSDGSSANVRRVALALPINLNDRGCHQFANGVCPVTEAEQFQGGFIS
jgi:hypothetical protein